MVQIVTQLASIAANTKVDVLSANPELTYLRSSNVPRVIQGIGLAGATVNTASSSIQIDGFDEVKLRNGVTNATGAPIKADDATDTEIVVDEGSQLSIFVENTTGGALQFYLFLDIEDLLE